MTQRKLKKQLRQYAAECKMLIPKEKEKQIVSLLQAESRVQTKALLQEKAPYKTRGSAVSFVLEQIGYLGKYCLVWQIAWIVLFCYLMRHSVGYFSGKRVEWCVGNDIAPAAAAGTAYSGNNYKSLSKEYAGNRICNEVFAAGSGYCADAVFGSIPLCNFSSGNYSAA